MELAAATLAPRRRAARCFTGLAAHIEMQLLPAEACSRRRDARFTLAGGLCLDAVDILGYPKGYSQPSTPIKWSQKVAVVSSGGGVHIITGNLCPIPAHAHIGAIMPETLESTPPSQTTGAGAQIRTLGNRRRRTMLDAGRSTPSQSDANARSSLLRTRTRPTRNGDASANVLPSRLPLIRLG